MRFTLHRIENGRRGVLSDPSSGSVGTLIAECFYLVRWVAPCGSERECVGICMWIPRLGFLNRLLVAGSSVLPQEAPSLLIYLAN